VTSLGQRKYVREIRTFTPARREREMRVTTGIRAAAAGSLTLLLLAGCPDSDKCDAPGKTKVADHGHVFECQKRGDDKTYRWYPAADGD
jgi:hypothetical protein